MTSEHRIIFSSDLFLSSDFRITWRKDRFFISKQHGLFHDEQTTIGTVYGVNGTFVARSIVPLGPEQTFPTIMAAVGYLMGLQPRDDPWQQILDRIITGVKTIISRVIDCVTLLYTTMKAHTMKGPEA